MELKGSVAVISGGASGLGEATARFFCQAGAKVCMLDMNRERGEALSLELGENALFCETDVTSPESAQDALDAACERFGAVNIAVNCAGIAPPAKVLGKKGPMDLGGFAKVVSVNLIGTMNIIRLAAEKMAKNGKNAEGEVGVIINTASIAAFDGQIGQAAYSASKAGVVGLTLPIAREFADLGIRVVTIAPGLFHTPLMDSLPAEAMDALGKTVPFPKRLGFPREFAFMAGHIVENVMLNGETIRLDGALRMAAR